ncbi:Armadillo-type fold containing protein [Parasponia andersonii]|uniref:Armadillo-type fold containing protein n=1 Tax=Parasponia andersonii TaxID=3476 RepID=A0A2P5CCT0_PARAD|nr:Armadillo-type fold containing protein [Parasponia andersonii]
MHKAENNYEVGKVRDEEAAKQRRLRAILNKLTPQNFEKLFEQVKAVNIDNAGTLCGVIAQIFDRAIMEPSFCEMYVCLCFHLSGELPDFSENNEKITFKRLLLSKCQEEFERGEREQEEANKADEEGEVKQSEEEREEKRIKASRRMLGNIRLIGELYKKKMLTERIMHECIKKLLGQPQTPDEVDVEALCILMSTVGEIIDHPKAKKHMDAYFEGMKSLSNNMKLSSRVRLMLKDAIDLRKNKWQQRRKVEGPKKIEEVHRDAAQERQAQASRLGDISPSSPRKDLIPSFVLDRFLCQTASDQSIAPEQSGNYGGRDLKYSDHIFDRSSSAQNTPSEKMWPEERLPEKPRTTIKEVCRDSKMAPQGSNSSSRWINFHNKKCKCGKNALLRISESINNPNRLYYCCANGESSFFDCGFSEWWVPKDSAQPLDMITEDHNQYPKLVQKIIALEANVSAWKIIILLNFLLSMFIILIVFCVLIKV